MFSVMLLSVTFLFSGSESAYLDRIDTLRDSKGLFLDRRSDPTTVSAAATGFGVLALAEGASRGLRDREETLEIARVAFERTVNANPKRNRGWLSHFTDIDGNPKPYSEVSTIDTAIFYFGMLRAAQLLNAPELEAQFRSALNQIDTKFVLRDGYFLHGFHWTNEGTQLLTAAGGNRPAFVEETPQFIPYTWSDSSEGAILYRLFDLPFQFQIRRTDYPLFVYAYPLCFYNDPVYETLLKEAIEAQIKLYGYWGVTSTNGPQGYVILDRNVISPVLIGGIATKYPEYLEALKSLVIQVSAVSMHLPTGWIDNDDLTIDLASAYILFSKFSREAMAPHAAPVATEVEALKTQEPIDTPKDSVATKAE